MSFEKKTLLHTVRRALSYMRSLQYTYVEYFGKMVTILNDIFEDNTYVDKYL